MDWPSRSVRSRIEWLRLRLTWWRTERGKDPPARRVGDPSLSRDSDAHAVRAEAEATMEDHDVDDMLDAILERRRARGRRELGDAMAEELLREDGQQ